MALLGSGRATITDAITTVTAIVIAGTELSSAVLPFNDFS
jgi:hypothetical protein